MTPVEQNFAMFHSQSLAFPNSSSFQCWRLRKKTAALPEACGTGYILWIFLILQLVCLDMQSQIIMMPPERVEFIIWSWGAPTVLCMHDFLVTPVLLGATVAQRTSQVACSGLPSLLAVPLGIVRRRFVGQSVALAEAGCFQVFWNPLSLCNYGTRCAWGICQMPTSENMVRRKHRIDHSAMPVSHCLPKPTRRNRVGGTNQAKSLWKDLVHKLWVGCLNITC